jgi:nucleotide-binding universal stress UspA family protein
MFKHLLVPIDGSECSLRALDVAAAFACDQQARVTICTVTDPFKAAAMSFGEASMAAACLDALDEEANLRLKSARERVSASCTPETALLEGPAVGAILEFAGTCGADVIVMGSHGRTGLQRIVLGSVAEGVLRGAPVPVLIVRQASAAAPPRSGRISGKPAATTPP